MYVCGKPYEKRIEKWNFDKRVIIQTRKMLLLLNYTKFVPSDFLYTISKIFCCLV